MPYLRCEACGAKALPIATRCPTCETPFEVRGTGASASQLRPCSACDSLLSREAESCPWCGEEVRRGPSRVALLAMAASLVIVLAGGWAFMGSRAGEVVTLSAPADSQGTAVAMGSAEAQERAAPRSTRDTTPAAGPSPDPGQPPAPGQTRNPAPEQGTAVTQAPAQAPAQAPEPRAVFSEPEPATSDGWVRAVARTFVNIRSAPASDSEVQGVVAENDVVFLGDARGAWRQVRTTSGLGWVWEPLFQVGSEGP